MGASFKSDIPDYRNSKALDLFKLLKKKYLVDIHDPLIDPDKFFNHEKSNDKKIKKNYYDVIIISVKHKEIKKIGLKKF